MMNAIVAATPTEMGDDGFLHEVGGAGAMGNMRSGGEGTAAGAVHAALHVAAALVQRERTGEGCFIDVAGHDGVVVNGWIAATYLLNEHRITDRAGMPARARRPEHRREVPVLRDARRQRGAVLLRSNRSSGSTSARPSAVTS